MDKKLLFEILEIESHSRMCEDMATYLKLYAKEKGYTWFPDTTGNIFMQKGESKTYPCMVAHMDTVHRIHGHGITIVTVGDKVTGFDHVTMEQSGIGGDDKCGIYAALHCMEKLAYCKAAFFVDEEIGCKGSGNCYMKFFEDCRFVLQADRRGFADFVTDINGPLSSKKFLKHVAPIIKKHGYSESLGMMSDVMALRDNNIGISVANMSAGYYNPHRDCEYIDLVDLENVSVMMETIGRELTRVYPFRYEEPPSKFGSHFGKVVSFNQFGQSCEDWEGNLWYQNEKGVWTKRPKERFPDYQGSALGHTHNLGWREEEETETPLEAECNGHKKGRKKATTLNEWWKMKAEDDAHEAKMLALEEEKYQGSIMGV